MNARNILTICGLLIVAVGSWYLANSNQKTEVTKTISDTTFGGFYLRSARILGTDDDGQLLYEIEADYVGKIAKIMVENAQPVEYNQVLFLIEKYLSIVLLLSNPPFHVSSDHSTLLSY